MTATFATTASGRRILRDALEEAVRLLRADGGMVYVSAAGVGGREARDGELRLIIDAGLDAEGITGRAARLGRPVWTGDYLNDPRFVHREALDAFARSNGIRSAMAAPIAAETGILGTLTVFTARPDDYDEADAELLTALSDQASLAITNARRIEALTRSRSELAERALLERGLREITAGITAERDLDAVLHRIASEASRLTGNDRVFINVLNDPGSPTAWTWYSPTGTGTDPWDPFDAMSLQEGVTGRAFTDRQTFISGCYLEDDRFVHRPDRMPTCASTGCAR